VAVEGRKKGVKKVRERPPTLVGEGEIQRGVKKADGHDAMSVKTEGGHYIPDPQ